MSVEVKLPQFGMGMSEGTVSTWLKQVGDRVTEGEPLAEIEVEKAVMELVAPADGVISAQLVPAGETAPVYAVLAILD